MKKVEHLSRAREIVASVCSAWNDACRDDHCHYATHRHTGCVYTSIPDDSGGYTIVSRGEIRDAEKGANAALYAHDFRE